MWVTVQRVTPGPQLGTGTPAARDSGCCHLLSLPGGRGRGASKRKGGQRVTLGGRCLTSRPACTRTTSPLRAGPAMASRPPKHAPGSFLHIASLQVASNSTSSPVSAGQGPNTHHQAQLRKLGTGNIVIADAMWLCSASESCHQVPSISWLCHPH
jgi:hypothetical protein